MTPAELEHVRAAAAAAEPGEWLVRDGRVVRHGGAPVASEASLSFIAGARAWVPLLLDLVGRLEHALLVATAEAHSLRVTLRNVQDEFLKARAVTLEAAGAMSDCDGETIRIQREALVARISESAARAAFIAIAHDLNKTDALLELYAVSRSGGAL